jgi:hypothetical protein
MMPPTNKISATYPGYFNENEAKIVREGWEFFGRVNRLISCDLNGFF